MTTMHADRVDVTKDFRFRADRMLIENWLDLQDQKQREGLCGEDEVMAVGNSRMYVNMTLDEWCELVEQTKRWAYGECRSDVGTDHPEGVGVLDKVFNELSSRVYTKGSWLPREVAEELRKVSEEKPAEQPPPELPDEKPIDQICETLIREMGRARSWRGVEDAWEAILKVRRIAKDAEIAERVRKRAGDRG